jgi:hypothetical protein
MGLRRVIALWATVLLGGAGAALAAEPSPAPAPSPAAAVHKSVYGKLHSIDRQLGGLIMITDAGKKTAWRFDPALIEKVSGYKKGDAVVVIYRQRGSDKAVTAVAFPGAAAAPVYENLTGHPIELAGGPKVDGVCGRTAVEDTTHATVAIGAVREVPDECWCCAPAGEACIPANKTGLGHAFLVRCYP